MLYHREEASRHLEAGGLGPRNGWQLVLPELKDDADLRSYPSRIAGGRNLSLGTQSFMTLLARQAAYLREGLI